MCAKKMAKAWLPLGKIRFRMCMCCILPTVAKVCHAYSLCGVVLMASISLIPRHAALPSPCLRLSTRAVASLWRMTRTEAAHLLPSQPESLRR